MPELRKSTKEKSLGKPGAAEDADSDEGSVSNYSRSSSSSSTSTTPSTSSNTQSDDAGDSDRPEDAAQSANQPAQSAAESDDGLERANWSTIRADAIKTLAAMYNHKVESTQSKVLQTMSKRVLVARRGWWPIQPSQHKRLWADDVVGMSLAPPPERPLSGATQDLRDILSVELEQLIKRQLRRMEKRVETDRKSAQRRPKSLKPRPETEKSRTARKELRKKHSNARKALLKKVEKQVLQVTMDQITQEVDSLCLDAMERRLDDRRSRTVLSVRKTARLGQHMHKAAYPKIRRFIHRLKQPHSAEESEGEASETTQDSQEEHQPRE